MPVTNGSVLRETSYSSDKKNIHKHCPRVVSLDWVLFLSILFMKTGPLPRTRRSHALAHPAEQIRSEDMLRKLFQDPQRLPLQYQRENMRKTEGPAPTCFVSSSWYSRSSVRFVLPSDGSNSFVPTDVEMIQ